MKKGLIPEQINRLFAVVLAIFLAIAGLLYWQGEISLKSLLLIAVIVLVVAGSYIFGIRVAQKDGFLDGYVRAKNHFDKGKKS